MEAVELVVYLAVALMVGVAIFFFLTNWDVSKTLDFLKKTVTGERELRFEEVDSEGFARRAYAVWEDCGFGEVKSSLTLFVKGRGNLTKQYLFTLYKKINLCDTVQSARFNCGSREDVEFQRPVTLPSIVTITCNNSEPPKLIIS